MGHILHVGRGIDRQREEQGQLVDESSNGFAAMTVEKQRIAGIKLKKKLCKEKKRFVLAKFYCYSSRVFKIC